MIARVALVLALATARAEPAAAQPAPPTEINAELDAGEQAEFARLRPRQAPLLAPARG